MGAHLRARALGVYRALDLPCDKIFVERVLEESGGRCP